MEYELWFREGIEDFERARKFIDLSEIKAAYFYMQQAVEKILKSLMAKKSMFIKSHDISLLYNCVVREYGELAGLSSEDIEVLKSLTIHYFTSRYPNARLRLGLSEEFYRDVSEARRVLEVIEKLIEIAKKLITDPPKFGFDEFGRNIDHVIAEYVKRISKCIPLACAIVFGSRSRGDWKPWSDVDVLLVLHEMEINDFNEVFKLFHEPLVDFRIYTVSDAVESIKRGDPTILLALHEGVVVYDDGTYSYLRKLLNKLWIVKVLRRGVVYKFIRKSNNSN